MAEFTLHIIGTVIKEGSYLGEAVSRGDIIYLDEDSKWYRASASNEKHVNAALWISLKNGEEGDEVSAFERGYFDYGVNDITLTPGVPYYLSTSSGKITSDNTVQPENFLKYIGEAIDSSKLYFEPSSTYIKGDGKEVNGVELKSDLHYVHTQSQLSNEWDCIHNLGKLPSVSIINTASEIIVGKVEYINNNNVKLLFTVPVSGKAFFN